MQGAATEGRPDKRKNREHVREIGQREFQMDEERIRELLRSHKHSNGRRTFGCPDENHLAAYVDGQVAEGARSSLEKHASSCDICLESLGFLARSADWPDSSHIPAALLVRARELVAEKPGASWRWRWAIATAAAACVLLAITFVFLKSRVQQPHDRSLVAQINQPTPAEVGPTVEPSRPATSQSASKPNVNQAKVPTVRGSDVTAKPKLLFPREGSVLRQNNLVFRWEPTTDAVLYTVRVAAADGSLVMQKESKEPMLPLGDDVALSQDATYYVTVMAHTSDGRLLKYEIRSFRSAKE